MISHVIEALQGAESVRSITITGPRDAILKHLDADGINRVEPETHPGPGATAESL